jgi:hypothetical protein
MAQVEGHAPKVLSDNLATVMATVAWVDSVARIRKILIVMVPVMHVISV